MSIYEKRPWLSSYPTWVPPDLDTAGFTPIEDFKASATRRPEAPAIYYFDHVISYGEIDRLSDALAVAFHDLGLTQGDRIIVDLQNVPQVSHKCLCCMEARGHCGSSEPHVQGERTRLLL